MIEQVTETLKSATLFASTAAACNAAIANPGLQSGKILDGTIFLDFEFLNYRDGFVEIVHNCAANHQIELLGTLIGAKPIEGFSLNTLSVCLKRIIAIRHRDR